MSHAKTQEQAREVFTGTFMQKILDAQPKLEQIYVNAMQTSPPRQCMIVRSRNEKTDRVFVVERACMRSGFKVVYTPKTGIYELLRTNTSDFYKHADEAEIEFFLKHGWLNGCDLIQLKRDKARLKSFNRKIDKANSSRNDSLMVHWRKRRIELINNISSIEEAMNRRNGQEETTVG